MPDQAGEKPEGGKRGNAECQHRGRETCNGSGNDSGDHPERSNSDHRKRRRSKQRQDVTQYRRPREIGIRETATPEIRESNADIAGNRHGVADEKPSGSNQEEFPIADLHVGLQRQEHCPIPEQLGQKLTKKGDQQDRDGQALEVCELLAPREEVCRDGRKKRDHDRRGQPTPAGRAVTVRAAGASFRNCEHSTSRSPGPPVGVQALYWHRGHSSPRALLLPWIQLSSCDNVARVQPIISDRVFGRRRVARIT